MKKKPRTPGIILSNPFHTYLHETQRACFAYPTACNLCFNGVSHNPDIMTSDILRATKAQMDMMVSLMEENTGKMRSLKFWTKLSSRLNSIGPPVRSATQWRKEWHCLTCKVRRKCQERARTMTLTPNEAKVARLIRYRVSEYSEEEISQDILEDTSEDTPIQRNTAVSSTQETPPVEMQSFVQGQERFLQIMENLTTVISGKLEELVQIEREKLELMRKK